MGKIPELVEAEKNFIPVSMGWDPSNTTTRYYYNEDDYNLTTNLIGPSYITNYTVGIAELTTIFNTKMATPIFSGTISVAAAVEIIKYEVQAILDQYN